jgi:hypothetical protein
MNAILLGGACLGALALFLTTDPQVVARAKAELRQGEGSMTRDITVNPETGAIEETSVLAFLDP